MAGTGLLFAAGDKKEAAVKKDREKMKGTWKVASLVMDGKKVPGEELQKLKILIGADGAMTVQREGETIIKTTNKIDPTKKPKAIDVTFTMGELKDKSALGIYEIDGDTIKYCRASPGKDRPAEFSSKEGSGTIFAVYKREKSK
jgi:uncharacterized protein (TIGR03067 family)